MHSHTVDRRGGGRRDRGRGVCAVGRERWRLIYAVSNIGEVGIKLLLFSSENGGDMRQVGTEIVMALLTLEE